MPPIPSARSSATSMKSSSSRESNGYLPSTPQSRNEESNGTDSGLQVVGETGSLELNSTIRKKSDAEKLSDIGFNLYTTEHTKKLPKILTPKSKVKGTKRKKIKEDKDSKSKQIVTEVNENRVDISRKGGEGNSVVQASTGEEDADYYNKYGLDPRRQFGKSREVRGGTRGEVQGVRTPLRLDELELFKISRIQRKKKKKHETSLKSFFSGSKQRQLSFDSTI